MQSLNTFRVANHLSKGSAVWLPRSIMVGIVTELQIASQTFESALSYICRTGNIDSLEYILHNYQIKVETLGNLFRDAIAHNHSEIVFSLFDYLDNVWGEEDKRDYGKYIALLSETVFKIFALTAKSNRWEIALELLRYADDCELILIPVVIKTVLNTLASHDCAEIVNDLLNYIIVKDPNMKLKIIDSTSIYNLLKRFTEKGNRGEIMYLLSYFDNLGLESMVVTKLHGLVPRAAELARFDILEVLINYTIIKKALTPQLLRQVLCSSADGGDVEIFEHVCALCVEHQIVASPSEISSSIECCALRGYATMISKLFAYSEQHHGPLLTLVDFGESIYVAATGGNLDALLVLIEWLELKDIKLSRHDISNSIDDSVSDGAPPVIQAYLRAYAARHDIAYV